VHCQRSCNTVYLQDALQVPERPVLGCPINKSLHMAGNTSLAGRPLGASVLMNPVGYRLKHAVNLHFNVDSSRGLCPPKPFVLGAWSEQQ
jgi:hypothetical protein